MNNWYDDDDISGNFLSCKEGQTIKIKVKEIKKVVGDKFSKFNYKKKDGSPILTKEEQAPFHHELIADDDRVLTVGALALIGALRKAKVVAGDEIELSHPARGKYVVVKEAVADENEFDTDEVLGKDIPF